MNNSAVHQSLIELEENLKNLDSARKQVEGVSEKSEQIIAAFSKVLNVVDSLQIDFEGENGVFNEAISTSIDNFNKTLDNETSNFVKKLMELSQSISGNVDNSIQDLNAFQSKIDEEKSRFLAGIEKSFGDLNSTIENRSVEFVKKFDELNQNYSKAVNFSIERLDVFGKTVDEAANKIVNYNVEMSISDLKKILKENNTSIDKIHQSQTRSSKWIKIILVAGFLAVIATIIGFQV